MMFSSVSHSRKLSGLWWRLMGGPVLPLLETPQLLLMWFPLLLRRAEFWTSCVGLHANSRKYHVTWISTQHVTSCKPFVNKPCWWGYTANGILLKGFWRFLFLKKLKSEKHSHLQISKHFGIQVFPYIQLHSCVFLFQLWLSVQHQSLFQSSSFQEWLWGSEGKTTLLSAQTCLRKPLDLGQRLEQVPLWKQSFQCLQKSSPARNGAVFQRDQLRWLYK